MMMLAGDPAFREIHQFKIAATATTFSFPTRPFLMLLVGPRVWVGLIVALVAALSQIALMSL
jgi:hypothetical protein